MIVTEGALAGLERCRRFLAEKNPEVSRRAAMTITRHFLSLEEASAIGRPHASDPELRELLIEFGDSGYVALYREDPADDTVVVLAFRHQREAGFL